MAAEQTLILALPNFIVYLVASREGRWSGLGESWSKPFGYETSSSADTSRIKSAQVYALRAFHSKDNATATADSAGLIWRPASEVLRVRRLGDKDIQGDCERRGCKHAPEFIAEFVDFRSKPEEWPKHRFFCKGHVRKFLKDRGMTAESN